MPGLKYRSTITANPARARAATWRPLLLMLCLVCANGPLVAQETDSSLIEPNTAIADDADAILSGIEFTRRVLGGDNSRRGDWPSMVALVSPGISSLKNRFFCGGTIIAERWVMTAAHCLFDTFRGPYTVSDIRVVAGIYDLAEDAELDEVEVTNIIVHPDYDNSKTTPPNDIALLELSRALDAPIGELFVGESEDYSGTIGHIVGWGATQFSNERAFEYPAIQQEAPVPLVSLDICNSDISYAGFIAVTQLCAGYSQGQIDTCNGDSGGPLYIIEDDRVIQMGITSFGSGCGLENFYGIYTNVSHYIPWLSDYVTVPEQSSELIDRRQAAINGGTTEDSSGAMNPVYLLLLVVVSLLRGRALVALPLHGNTLWRSVKFRISVLVALLALLLSACTVPSVGAQSSHTSPADTSNQEKSNMPQVHALTLNDNSLRSGVDGLPLGARHEDLVSSLKQAHWQQPVCESGKTALRGTGRLFQTDHCSVDADGTVAFHGRQVQKLDLFLLDQQLVRIDVVLADSTAIELSDRAGANLSDLLENQYRGPGVALPSEKGGTVWLWQHEDDQIRWYPERRLQFIDGRLEYGLPALYQWNPPFSFD